MSLKTRKISSLLIFLFCLTSTIFVIVMASKVGVKSLDEITEIESSIKDIIQKRINHSYVYDLKIQGYDNIFKVGADYENLFNYHSLINEIKPSEYLYFAISTKQIQKLNNGETIHLYGIRSDSKIYLDKHKTIEKSRLIRQYLAPIGGAILLILSIGVYIYRRYYYRYDL